MATNFEEREREVLNLLDSWPWKLGGVVIGGYAVAAYGKPRYSNDLDVMIPRKSTIGVMDWLLYNGYRLAKSAVPNPQNYDGEVFRFENDGSKSDLISVTVP